MNEFIKNTCKIGQGHDCCRYLMMGTKGFECAKLVLGTKSILDARGDNMNARGNNCEGITEYGKLN